MIALYGINANNIIQLWAILAAAVSEMVQREIGFDDLKSDRTKMLVWIGACLGIISYVIVCAILIFGLS